MRLLADENFPKPIVDALRADGHDVVWADTDYPGWPDVALLEEAESGERILLTLDKGFSQLAIQRRIPLASSGVVVFRAHPATPQSLITLVRAFVTADRTWAGHVSIVTVDVIHSVPTRRN